MPGVSLLLLLRLLKSFRFLSDGLIIFSLFSRASLNDKLPLIASQVLFLYINFISLNYFKKFYFKLLLRYIFCTCSPHPKKSAISSIASVLHTVESTSKQTQSAFDHRSLTCFSLSACFPLIFHSLMVNFY